MLGSTDLQRDDPVVLKLEHMVEIDRTAREIAGHFVSHDDLAVPLRYRERLDRVTVFFARFDPPGLYCLEALDRLALIAHSRISGEARIDCGRIVEVLRRKIDADRF